MEEARRGFSSLYVVAKVTYAKKKRRAEKERGEPCDIQESLEREEPRGSLVIARLPLARRCIFRTEIKVYDAR